MSSSKNLNIVTAPNAPLIPQEDAEVKALVENIIKNPSTLGVVEFLTGIAVSNRSDLILSGGRIAQSAMRGDFRKRLATEIVSFRKKGTSEDETLNSAIGRDSLREMLEFIETGPVNEELFIAMKSIFLNTITSTNDEKRREMGVILLKICKNLDAMDILVLKSCYEIYVSSDDQYFAIQSYSEWFSIINDKIGYGLPQLIEKSDDKLVEMGLLEARTNRDKSGIWAGKRFRLTEGLGLTICEFITSYP